MLHLQLVGLLHMHASCISAACGDIDHAPARYPAAPDSIIEPNNKSLDSSPGAHSQPPPAPAVARPANTRLRGRRCLLPYTIASIHPSIDSTATTNNDEPVAGRSTRRTLETRRPEATGGSEEILLQYSIRVKL